MMKRLLLSILLILLLPCVTHSQGREILVSIDIREIQDITVLQDVPMRICLRHPSYLIATMDRKTLSQLNDFALAFRIIDEDAWSGSYYLIAGPVSSGKCTPIFQSGDDVIVKIAQEHAEHFTAEGLHIARIFDRSFPLMTKAARMAPWQTGKSLHSDEIGVLTQAISDSAFRAYVQRLQDFETRYCRSDSTLAVRNWLLDKFREFTYADVRSDPFVEDRYSTQQFNVLAIKPGTQGTDRVIIIGGHYDSIVSDPSLRFISAPGADDNGTGTAGALELARVLADVDLETTVIFIAFAAEEIGLMGSEHYANTARENSMIIDLMINMDMIGTQLNEIMDFNIRTDTQSTAHAQLIASLSQKYTQLIPLILPSSGNSDHFYFQQNGYPAIFIQETDFSQVYHSPKDLIEYLTIPYATEVLKSVLALIVTVSNTPAAPTGLVAFEVGDGRTQVLQWNEARETDIALYKIYLGSQKGIYDRVIESHTTTDTLTNLAENKAAYAAVSAVDVDANESLLSEEIMFVPEGNPATPLGVEAVSGQSSVGLSWLMNNDEFDFAGYVIVRTGPSDEETRFIVDAAAASFEDRTLEPHILYRYTIQARDTDGNVSDPSDIVYGQLATHDRGILVVDGTKDGMNQPLRPTDEAVDQFYATLLRGFDVNRTWDLEDSSGIHRPITDADMGIHSTIIWHSDILSSPRNISQDTLAIKKYVQNGGQLLLIGWNVIQNISKKSELTSTFRPGQFIYDYLKVAQSRNGSIVDQDFIGANPDADSYPEIDVDSSKTSLSRGTLFAMEVIETVVDPASTEVLYTYRSSNEPPSGLHGKAVALRRPGIIFIDFPLFFMEAEESGKLLGLALNDLGEQGNAVPIDRPDDDGVPAQFHLAQNYPNPFNGQSRIRFDLPGNARGQIAVYDIQGRLVHIVHQGFLPHGSHEFQIDMDNVPSGVYLLTFDMNEFRDIIKIVLLK